MRPVLQAVMEGFPLVGGAEAAAEIKDGIVIVQGQGCQETLQFLETIADFRWVGFVGFGIGLVELVKNSFTITIPRIKWMVACVGFQCFGKGLQDNTSKKVCVMLPWKCGYCKSSFKMFSDIKLRRVNHLEVIFQLIEYD